MSKGIGIQLVDNNDAGVIMDLKIAVKRDAAGKIVSGLVINTTLEQNKALILLAHQGEIKFKPDLGVGFEDILLSSDYLEYRHKIREHFAKDGLRVTRVEFYENEPFDIQAVYDS